VKRDPAAGATPAPERGRARAPVDPLALALAQATAAGRRGPAPMPAGSIPTIVHEHPPGCSHVRLRLPGIPPEPRPAAMPPRSARKSASAARLQRETAHDEIYEKIYVAILEHRLHPGTKLVEERLAEIFGVSRARIREVLARLAHEQIVELIPQRGAYVAKPSIEQALDVFEARRLIEPAVVRRLIETLTPEKLARLKLHQDLEMDARRRDDKRAVIRLSGEFHSLAAELAGNSALARSMRELSTLTCLMIFLYDAPTSTSCRPDEHSRIIDAVARRDIAGAERLMLEHLDHIENGMKLEAATEEVDLEAIFRDG
jgi:DNA-binding GntR family transcriptional regulator